MNKDFDEEEDFNLDDEEAELNLDNESDIDFDDDIVLDNEEALVGNDIGNNNKVSNNIETNILGNDNEQKRKQFKKFIIGSVVSIFIFLILGVLVFKLVNTDKEVSVKDTKPVTTVKTNNETNMEINTNTKTTVDLNIPVDKDIKVYNGIEVNDFKLDEISKAQVGFFKTVSKHIYYNTSGKLIFVLKGDLQGIRIGLEQEVPLYIYNKVNVGDKLEVVYQTTVTQGKLILVSLVIPEESVKNLNTDTIEKTETINN